MPKGIPKSGVNKGWFKKGQMPWCKGLTKETDSRIARSAETIGEKVRKKLKGKTYEEIYGVEKAEELKKSRREIAFRTNLGKINRVSWNKGLTMETDERIARSSKNISLGLIKFYSLHTVSEETRQKLSVSNSGENNWTTRDTPEVKEKLIKIGMAGIAGVRKNRKTCRFMDVSFDSKKEMEVAIWLNKNLGFVPLERKNCHVVVSGKEIDFFLKDKDLFIEYHPCGWILNPETKEEYYDERRKAIDNSKFFNCKVIVVETIEELKKLQYNEEEKVLI